jgi:hypothetical protein
VPSSSCLLATVAVILSHWWRAGPRLGQCLGCCRCRARRLAQGMLVGACHPNRHLTFLHHRHVAGDRRGHSYAQPGLPQSQLRASSSLLSWPLTHASHRWVGSCDSSPDDQSSMPRLRSCFCEPQLYPSLTELGGDCSGHCTPQQHSERTYKEVLLCQRGSDHQGERSRPPCVKIFAATATKVSGLDKSKEDWQVVKAKRSWSCSTV